MTQKRISSFISKTAAISLVALVCATAANAQGNMPKQNGGKTMTGKAAKLDDITDTIPLLRGVAVSVDAVGLAQKAFSDYGQYEASLRINLKDKYFPVVELGYGSADANDPTTNLSYKTSAPYGRIGVDFNIAKNKHDDYRIYAGLRYAMTYYKFDVIGHGVKDPVWGDDVKYEAHDVKANYHWLEGVFGVDAKIAGPLRLGWSVRYRRRVASGNGDIGNTWYVPGYGKQGSSRIGGSFNIIFEL